VLNVTKYRNGRLVEIIIFCWMKRVKMIAKQYYDGCAVLVSKPLYDERFDANF